MLLEYPRKRKELSVWVKARSPVYLLDDRYFSWIVPNVCELKLGMGSS